METVDKLKYNGGEVLKLLWNGTEVSTLRHLGLQKEWSAGEELFELRMFGIDASGRLQVRYSPETMQYDYFDQFFGLNSSSSFLCYINGSNYEDLAITGSQSNRGFYYFIDDYALAFGQSYGYGSWVTDGSERYFIINSTKHPEKPYKIRLTFQIDEDNELLLRGDLYNKVMRIPASGYHGNIAIKQYPYTFNAPEYIEDPELYILRIYNRTDMEINLLGMGKGEIDIHGEWEFALTRSENSTLDYNLEYIISENQGNSFKEYPILISAESLDGVSKNWQEGTNMYNQQFIPTGLSSMLHIIQEPRAKNRIYWGYGKFNGGFPDDYDDLFANRSNTNDNTYQYHCLFETLNSKVLKDNFTLPDFASDWWLCIPEDFDFNVEFLGNNATPRQTNYYWGDQAYSIYRFYQNRPTSIQFTRKT